MNKFFALISSTAIAGIILGAPMTHKASAQEVAELTPTSSWATKAIGQGTENGYCALSRQYGQNLVLTLGQNTIEEYSLAIDFVDGSLDVDKAYGITLQPGPGQIRAYEMMPASNRAIVIRLGYDESFIDGLKASGLLKAEIEGKKYDFTLSEFAQGEKSLSECMQALKGESGNTQLASSDFSAEKVENAPPMDEKPVAPVAEEPQIAKAEEPAEPAVSPEVKDEPEEKISIEKTDSIIALKAPDVNTVQMPTESAEAIETPELIIVSRVSSEIVEEEPVLSVEQEEIQALEEAGIDVDNQETQKIAEQEKARQAEQAQRESEEAEKAKREAEEAQQIALREQAEKQRAEEQAKLAAEKAQAEAQQAAAQAAQLAQAKQQEQARLAAEQQKSAMTAAQKEAELVKLAMEKAQQQADKAKQTPLTSLKEPAAPVIAPKQKISEALPKGEAKANEEAAKAEEVARLEAKEKQRIAEDLKKQQEFEAQVKEQERLAALANQKAEEAKAAQERAAQTEEQLAQQDNQEDLKEQQIAKMQAQEKVAQEEVAAIKERMQKLEEENRELYLEARKARGAIDDVVIETGTEALKKIQEAERKLEAAKKDNLALSKEIEELKMIQQQSPSVNASNDQTYNAAAARYNEAEKEIHRLSLLLAQQRAIHEQEKQQLEQMLFDPAVTDKEQQRRLRELELQLASAERRLQEQELQKQGVMGNAPVNAVNSSAPSKVVSSITPMAPEEPISTTITPQPQVAMVEPQQPLKISRAVPQEDNTQRQIQLAEQEKLRKEAEAEKLKQQQLQQELQAQAAEAEALRRSLEEQKAKTAQLEMQKQQELQAQIMQKAQQTNNSEMERRAQQERAAREAMAQQKQIISSPVQTSSVYSQPPVEVSSLKAQTPISTQVPTGMGQTDLQQILSRSGMSVGNIRPGSKGQYSWNVGQLSGEARIVPSQQVGGMDQYIQSYMAQEKQKCSGDFASLPASNIRNGKGYEVACITSSSNMSSSVVFAQKGNEVIMIEHSVPAENMDVAIDARDRIAGSL